jgi:exodeoxyribonuclease VII large subunit
MQPSLFSLAPTLTVTQLIRQIKDVVESDDVLSDVWVRGEISNFSQAASGHIYFTLKDASSAVRCVMWRADAARVFNLPNDGDALDAHGRVSMYEARGDVQMYVDEISLSARSAGRNSNACERGLREKDCLRPSTNAPCPSSRN